MIDKVILDIQSQGKGNYLLTGEGCPLKFFSINEKGKEKNMEPVEGEDNFYQMSYILEKNKIYEFKAYGENENDVKGEMIYQT